MVLGTERLLLSNPMLAILANGATILLPTFRVLVTLTVKMLAVTATLARVVF